MKSLSRVIVVALRWFGLLAWAVVMVAAPAEEVLETAALRFRVSPADGRYELLDKSAGVTWRSNPFRGRWGEAVVRRAGGPVVVELGACEVQRQREALRLSFRSAGVDVMIRLLRDRRALEFSWSPEVGVEVESVRLLDEAFWATAEGGGAVLVPVRLGLRVAADSGLSFTHRFDTYAYEGCHMAMFGVQQSGAALLASWDDPYTLLELRSVVTNVASVTGRQVLAPSLTLRQSARSFRVRVLGRGDENVVAAAYRGEARDKGWLVTWDEKLKGHPERAQLWGASNYKLWSVLDRRMSEDSRREERVTVNWTFGEAADVAEHLKQDLQLDRVLFIMGGWIHRGYDNQHPDILPTAPECGGDAAFAACARRVREQGYLLGLHDNYQDIYRDAPSWDERWIMKTRDGGLAKGGHWAGGVACLTCARQALELARRPQNLPAVRQLAGPAAYFIDTTYAAGLQECFDPHHPLTRLDDLRWKQALSDYARGVFGVFGSECGREWAIPHADFFEGLTGVSGRGYHDAGLEAKLGAVGVPLFEQVYRDTVAMYGKYGYDIQRSTEYVLRHVSIARPLHYHNVPPHRYWLPGSAEESVLQVRALAPEVVSREGRRLRVRYAWEVARTPAADWRVFVHFTSADGEIRFQGDFAPATPTSAWRLGRHEEGPYEVVVPDGVEGVFDMRVGLFRPGGSRARLTGRDDGEQRYGVGQLRVAAGVATVAPGATGVAGASGLVVADAARYVNAEGGWAEGLHPYDRFVKNTHEILSPLNRLTAQVRLTRHEFLGPDRAARRTVFGEGRESVEVVINPGSASLRRTTRWGGEVVLPPGGFVAEGSTLAAFCATRWGGLDYGVPVLFVLESRDGKPLNRSGAVRVFHGFGDARVRLGAHQFEVPREAVVRAN